MDSLKEAQIKKLKEDMEEAHKQVMSKFAQVAEILKPQPIVEK